MKMPKPNGGGDFTPIAEGLHLAVCYRVVDLGTQETTYQGERRDKHQVLISWEIPEERITIEGENKPAIYHQRYTFSSHEKSMLRQHLEGWRGKRFTEAELDPSNPAGFDIRNLLGKSCQMQIVHKDVGDKTYANISSIVAKPKGYVDPKTENMPVYFSLEEFDQIAFNALPEWTQDAIRKSPEYQKLNRGSEPPPPDHTHDMEDTIPF